METADRSRGHGRMNAPTDFDADVTSDNSLVWRFFLFTLVAGTVIVYTIGYLADQPDATILAVFSPTAVAIVMTWRRDGWQGVRSLLRLRGDRSRWRTGLVTLFAIPSAALASIAIGNAVTDTTYPFPTSNEGLLILIPLLLVSIGEEFGWRSFALRRLVARATPLVPGAIVGLVWWIWHYPPSLIDTGVPLDTPFWLFGFYVVSLSIIMAYTFVATGRSMAIMVLVHTVSNLTFVFLPLLPEHRGGELTPFVVFIALAVIGSAVLAGVSRATPSPTPA